MAGKVIGSISTIAAWMLLAMAVTLVAIQAVRTDPGSSDIYADQATYLLAAMSMAYDLDQKYELHDLERFRNETPWKHPEGLFLKRETAGTYYYAKPFLFSTLSAPLVRAFGYKGVIYSNALLLCSILLSAFVITRRAVGNFTAALTVTGLLLLSPFYAYVLLAHADLFYASLLFFSLLALWKYLRTRSSYFPAITALLAAAAAYEKPFFAFVYIAFVPVVLRNTRVSHLLSAVLVAVLTAAAIASVSYNQDASLSPYTGDRGYYTSWNTGFPFDDGYVEVAPNSSASASFTLRVSYAIQQATGNFSNLPGQVIEALFGRNTGLIPYFPFILLAACLSFSHRISAFQISCWVGLVVYTIAYLLVFPENSFGGATSFGNRYAMQAMPLALLSLFPLGDPIAPRPRPAVIAVSLLALALGIFFMGDVLLRPFPRVRNHLSFAMKPKMSALPIEYSLLAKLFEDSPDQHWRYGNIDIYIVDYLSGPSGFPLTPSRNQTIIIESTSPINEISLEVRTHHRSTVFEFDVGKQRRSRFIPKNTTTQLDIELGEPTAIRTKQGSRYFYYRIRMSSDKYLFVSNPNFDVSQFKMLDADGGDASPCAELRDESWNRSEKRWKTDSSGDANDLLDWGWSRPESAHTWSAGPYSRVLIPHGEGLATGVGVEFTLRGYVNDDRKVAEVEVWTGNDKLTTWRFNNGQTYVCTVRIPAHLASEGTVAIDLRHIEPLSPSSTGRSDDPRALNIALLEIATYPIENMR
jgi:hypothetical protein